MPPPTVVSGIVRADDVVLLVVFEAVGGERRAPPSPRGILGIPKHPRLPHRRGRRAGPAASTFVLVFVTKFNFHSPPSFSPPPFLIGFLSLLKNFSSSALCRRDSALRGERERRHPRLSMINGSTERSSGEASLYDFSTFSHLAFFPSFVILSECPSKLAQFPLEKFNFKMRDDRTLLWWLGLPTKMALSLST